MSDLPLHVLCFRKTGALFVYDERYPGPSQDTVSGFSENLGETRLYRKEVVVGQVSRCQDQKKEKKLISRYVDWLETPEGQEYEEEAADWKERRISRTIARHAEEFRRKGISVPVTIRRSSKKRRITHCYACKSHLDNAITPECASCGWIICECGACGCFYDYA